MLGVADGHGGDSTSSFVIDRLAEGLFDAVLKEVTDPMVAMKKTFGFFQDATLRQFNEAGHHNECGTTLSLVFICPLKQIAYVGVIGDSPVILARQRRGIVHVSPEHNARSNERERKAAEERGGIFSGGYIFSPNTGDAGLQMTRDIGFYALGDVLERNPEVYNLNLEMGDVIIVASDGLFDPAHEKMELEARRIATLVLEGGEASDLVKDALARNTLDNVSSIVCRFT